MVTMVFVSCLQVSVQSFFGFYHGYHGLRVTFAYCGLGCILSLGAILQALLEARTTEYQKAMDLVKELRVGKFP